MYLTIIMICYFITKYRTKISNKKLIIYIFRNVKENKVINFWDSISFEIYLVHYMYYSRDIKNYGIN